MKHYAILAAIAPLAAAHWELVYPAPRAEGDTSNMPQFPCGGHNEVSAERTLFPIEGAPIQYNNGHSEYNIQVLLALGNEPGDAFNYVLVPTFTQEGPDDFCLGAGAIRFPEGLNITDGTNATIQVVTNGDSGGGLYKCADVTFTSTPLSSSEYDANCKNSTGVTATALEGTANANETESGHSHGSDDSANGTDAASTATSTGLASQATLASWGMAAIGVAAGVMAL